MKVNILILGLLLCTQIFSQNVPSYVPTNGLKGYWAFSGNAGDSSGNGYHGTVNGATPTVDRFGNPNASYSFNGVSTNIRIPYYVLSTYPCDSNWSVSLWLNLVKPLDSNSRFVAFINGGNPGQQGILQGAFAVYDPTSPDADRGITGDWYKVKLVQTIDTIFNKDQWYNFTYTFRNSDTTLKVYVDGFDQTTNIRDISGQGGSTINGGNWWVGSTGYNQSFFNGKIDDIGIWNRELTECEIFYLSGQTLDTSITQSNDTLFSNDTNATSYQWYDCLHDSVIVGATNRYYKVLFNGTYSVIVTRVNCVDTSSCFLYRPVGIKNNTIVNRISIYPNPNNGIFTIDLGKDYSDVKIEVFTLQGQLLFHEDVDQQNININLGVMKGVYLLKITSERKNFIKKIIIQ